MLFNLIISDYFLSRGQLRTSKNTKTSFQSSLRFCGKFSEFFFFMESSFPLLFLLLEHMARRTKKYMHTTKRN